MLKRAVSLLVAVVSLAACGGGSTAGGGDHSANAPAAVAKATGLGVLSERTFGDLEAKITAPEIAGDNYTGIQITLTDRTEKPVDGAMISATSSMPEHGMDGPELKSEPKGSGKYWMPGEMMKGKWFLNLSVKAPDGKSYSDTAEVMLP